MNVCVFCCYFSGYNIISAITVPVSRVFIVVNNKYSGERCLFIEINSEGSRNSIL